MTARPKAAPPVFPLPGHRTMAQVMEREERDRLRELRKTVPGASLHDYGSPFAVGRTA